MAGDDGLVTGIVGTFGRREDELARSTAVDCEDCEGSDGGTSGFGLGLDLDLDLTFVAGCDGG